MTIRVLKPGLLATVQDCGRPRWQAAGVPEGGAADRWSHRLANRLLGNPADAATLEVAPGSGFSAEVLKGGTLAATGAGVRLVLDGKSFEKGRRVTAPAGTLLELKPDPAGVYGYLAVSGGWDVPLALGSRSTCLAAGFGGLAGRSLQAGDVLHSLGADDFFEKNNFLGQSAWFARTEIPGADTEPVCVRMLPGPDWAHWPEDLQAQWLEQTYTVSLQRDRMGVYLRSLPLVCPGGAEKISSGVTPGAVQVPPDGQAIVLMADGQTTGGYPHIGQVIWADLPKMAQAPSGKSIRFRMVGWEEAEQTFVQVSTFKKWLI